jgi:hypothetical protein
MGNTKAVVWNFDAFPNPPDGYLLSYQSATGLWLPVNVPLGVNRKIHSTILVGSSPYTVIGADDFIPVDSSGGVITINLPASPATGKGYTIADINGNAVTNNITISGNGFLISGGGSYVLNTAFQSVTLVFNGVNWTKV